MRPTILVIVSILFGCLTVAKSSSKNQSKSTILQDSLLTRRVRALIFPNKASVLLTAAMTKIIVGGRPSGLQYSLEFDMYVPLPDTVEGWRPNILIPTTTTKKPAIIKPKRRWDWDWRGYGNSTTPNFYPYRRKSVNYYGPYHATAYEQYGKPKMHKDYFYKSPWQLTEQPWQRHRQDEETYESLADVPSWKLNRGYRERREIFDQLEAMGNFFQMDLKSCIKRAMCEFQARFNEQYHSSFLMEDLLRIILTVPEEIADVKYQNRMDVRNCARFYAVSCPYRVLDFITQTGRK